MRKTAVMLIVLFSILAFAFTCEDNEKQDQPREEELTGTWQLYETGYSPGSGYITEQVPLNPPQLITLKENKELETNISNLTGFKYYAVLDDGNRQVKILALFKTKPDNTIDITKLEHSYSIQFNEGKLKLSYRFCIEGCHMAFQRANEK